MPVLAIRHVTTYRYRQPVAFGEHRMMFRPREGHDQRLIEARLEITPEPAKVRWLHDVFGNSVAVAHFDGRARELRFESAVRLDHSPSRPLDFELDEHALLFPFSYPAEDAPDLGRSIERHYPDPDREVDRWARRFLREGGPTGTLDLLTAMTHAVRRGFTYIPRYEKGVQDPARTLRLGSGTCRDFAVLMMEAVRSLGLAARFVSGYLYSPGRDGGHVGGGSTHAWIRVYLPGAGWVEFDPTNGIVGNRDLVRVAIARDPAQAVPLSGTYTGFPSDSLDMTVEVSVSAEDSARDEPSPGARHAAAG
jgi:transglutaminase-like putative cysteine protease